MTESTPPPPDQGWSDRPATSTDPAPASTAWASPASTTTAVVPAPRPGMVTAAGVILIVLGVLTLVIGLFALLGAALFAGAAGSLGEVADTPAGFGGMMGAFAGLIIVFVVIVLAFGTLEILGGIKAMAGRSWARITGIVLGVIGALLSLSGLTSPDAGGGIVVSIAIAAAFAFVVFALATTGRWFAARNA